MVRRVWKAKQMDSAIHASKLGSKCPNIELRLWGPNKVGIVNKHNMQAKSIPLICAKEHRQKKGKQNPPQTLDHKRQKG